jgi:hypothetical protein
MTITAGRARWALLVTILVAAVALVAVTLRPQTAHAAPCAGQQHFYAEGTTNFSGFVDFDLPCEPGATAVVKVASGGTHLGGEDPSFATANFAGFVATNRIRVRVIGWHANTITGQAEFRYYSNKNVRLAVDVYAATA